MAITIPRYESQISPQSTPNARLNVDPSREAFGGGQSLENVQQATQGLLQTAVAERQKNDELVLEDFNSKLTQLKNKTVYDPTDGLLTKKGKDALSTPDEYSQRFRTGVEGLQEGLSNDNQRFMAKKLVASHQSELDDTIQKHVFNESQKYNDEVDSTAITTGIDDAALNYHDPKNLQTAIDGLRGTVLRWGNRNGYGENSDIVKQKLEDVTSKAHTGVIDRMLANGEDQKAKVYYDGVKDEVTGKDATALEKALDEGSVRGESQRQSDQITNSHPNLTSAMTEVKKISDPKIRDATAERVRQEFAFKEQAKRQSEEDNYLRATNLIEKNQGVSARDAVPPSLWLQLPLEKRRALEERANDPVNNDKVWLDFLDKSPTQLASLSRSDFESQYWVNFDKAHRSRAEAQWNQAHESATKDRLDPKLSSTLSFNERINGSLRSSGLISATKERGKFSKDEATLYAQFEQAAAKQVENFELNDLGGKRKATGDEVQKIIDDIVVKKVFVNKPWARDPEKPAAILTDEEKGAAYVPISKIPQGEKEKLAAARRKQGLSVSSDVIERAYGAYLTKNRALFDQIMGEK